MRTNLPAYPITVAGITIQVGPNAERIARELRGGQSLDTVYNTRVLLAPNVLIATQPAVLDALAPALQSALAKLQFAGALNLTDAELRSLSSCIDEAREYMGSNNYKVSAMLVPNLPGNAMAQIEAFDARYITTYTPVIQSISAKGLTADEVTAFVNCTPFHENRVIVRTGNDWRVN